MINTIIFDMDGTIVDSIPVHLEAWKETLEKYNIDLTIDLFNEVNGMSTPMIAEYIVKKFNLKIDPINVAITKRAIVVDKLKKGLNLFPNVKNTLILLKRLGFNIALATSSKLEHVEYSIGRHFNDFEFDCIVTGDDVLTAKPNPDIFLRCSELLNVKPENCIVVEDAVNGIIAAKKAKMKVIAITNTISKEFFNDADRIISDIGQITSDLIKTIENKTDNY
jgi:HAD superfamily hydrolase (TIGR01509 family)